MIIPQIEDTVAIILKYVENENALFSVMTFLLSIEKPNLDYLIKKAAFRLLFY